MTTDRKAASLKQAAIRCLLDGVNGLAALGEGAKDAATITRPTGASMESTRSLPVKCPTRQYSAG